MFHSQQCKKLASFISQRSCTLHDRTDRRHLNVAIFADEAVLFRAQWVNPSITIHGPDDYASLFSGKWWIDIPELKAHRV